MNTVIDTGSELLIDRSTLNDPFLRLIVAALGRSFVEGSPWVTVNKQDLGRAYPPTIRTNVRPKMPCNH
jgi:hypothetical protein